MHEPALHARGLPVTRATVVAALALAWALPSIASAQTVAPTGPVSAADHFALGSRLFAARAFVEAAREFELAYEASQRAELLFNLGRAREEAGQLASALDAYRRFDRAMPADFDRTTVLTRIDDLARLIARSTPPPAPAPALAPAPPLVVRPAPTRSVPPTRSGPPAGAVALMVGGGAVVLTGAVLGALANGALDGCRVDGDVARCPTQGELDRASGAPALATAANVSFVVGALAAAAGVMWWVLAPDRRVTVGAGPGSVSLAVRW